ncbi:hypothetical protein M426DRAFT_323790 [Hypoxylon sp. CI-4A]|nr:hypothetical protein M426DRAFT_323790 [Hypoxylon sp. CI-4A]
MSEVKTQSDAACPVDHKAREAWLSQARALNGEALNADGKTAQSLPPSHPTISSQSIKDSNVESCPVDHKSREAWLQQAARASSTPSSLSTSQPSAHPTSPPTTSTPTSTSAYESSSWTNYIPTSYLPKLSFWSSSTSSTRSERDSTSASARADGTTRPSSLATSRTVSSIPRSRDDGEPSSSARPRNAEAETGADSSTGNWIYPSERMFFEAMQRKGHDPRAADMRTVVPIHNAVNERAWAEIKAWEEPYLKGTACGGPRLHSFSGLSTNMSPKARINTLLGYQAPFDRHDWVVDRCGKEIEYVIDFYAGRNNGPAAPGKLSFYLDVRPKLNTWEGVKMRAMRAAGLA